MPEKFYVFVRCSVVVEVSAEDGEAAARVVVGRLAELDRDVSVSNLSVGDQKASPAWIGGSHEVATLVDSVRESIRSAVPEVPEG